MAVFQYQALDERYAPASGTIIADTPRQARDQLRSSGLMVEDIQPVTESPQNFTIRFQFRFGFRREAAKVGPWARQMSTLLCVGSPLLESMDLQAKQE